VNQPKTWTHTAYAQQLVFGADSVDRLGEMVKSIGLRRVMVVTTEGRWASEAGERVRRALGRAAASVFDGVRSHVPADIVQAAVAQARDDGVDGIVSFGGGSCADAAKAVAFFAEQAEGTPGTSHVDRPVLPHVSVTTTYSGAELTPFFGMTDPVSRRKTGAGGPTSAPVLAVYDPVLTLDLPAHISAETGMNALAHAVEAAYSPRRTPEAGAIALEAARRIGAALPSVVDDPGDLAARTAMFSGAALAGRCLMNASMGVHHGLAQLVGARCGIAHGAANAMLLCHAVAFNASAADDEVRAIGDALGDGDDPIGAIDRFRERLGLPSGLTALGVTEADLDVVAGMAMASYPVQTNVRPVTEDDARMILAAAM